MEDIRDLIVVEIPHMRRYARALVRDIDGADDLVQEALERALRQASKWRRAGTIRSWLLSILHNVYIDAQRRKKRWWHFSLDGYLADLPSHAPRQQDILECKTLLDAMDHLSEDQRETLILNAVEGLSYDEIARVMDVPIGTVRSRLTRGRERLKKIVDDAGATVRPVWRVK